LDLKARYLVCYWPWLTDATNLTEDQVKEAADSSNRIGEQCRATGLKFALHNHYQEFKEIAGRRVYDLLLEKTRPELVTMELDIYWMTKGGGDPVTYFQKYPGRFELLHAKDMDQMPEKGMACVGGGIIDFPKIFAHAKTGGVKHWIVEHDNPPDGLKCAEESFRYLNRIIA
jgi:sugar phosphate isomerase/epimerase